MSPGGIDLAGSSLGSSDASGAQGGKADSSNIFGSKTSSYNFGSGSATATSDAGMKWWMIAGLAVAALIAIKMLKK